MNDLLLLILGVSVGTYFAEDVRGVVPILDPKKGATEEGSS